MFATSKPLREVKKYVPPKWSLLNQTRSSGLKWNSCSRRHLQYAPRNISAARRVNDF